LLFGFEIAVKSTEINSKKIGQEKLGNLWAGIREFWEKKWRPFWEVRSIFLGGLGRVL
jgi:hypothetical protein